MLYSFKKYSEKWVKEVHISDDDVNCHKSTFIIAFPPEFYFCKIMKIYILDEILGQVNLESTFTFVLSAWPPANLVCLAVL